MTSANEALAGGDFRYFAPQHGKVIDNVDADNLYRVRVEIPGLCDDSGWALPVCTMGGGSPQRGGYVVPVIGADVIVWFVGGDPQFPIYASAWWGITPQDGSEMPTNAKNLDPKLAHLVHTFQLGSLAITIDERPGNRLFSIEDLTSGDAFVMDLEKQGMSITATSALLIKCFGVIDVDALSVNINGRIVLPDSKPI